MAQPIPDLWPDIEQSQVVPPVAILREQASLLGKKTNHLLEGRVDTATTQDGRFVHSFYIVAPTLDFYTYKLFAVNHDENLYPVQVGVASLGSERGMVYDKSNMPRAQADVASLGSEQELLEHIRKILNSDKTKRIVGSLLAQVKATA